MRQHLLHEFVREILLFKELSLPIDFVPHLHGVCFVRYRCEDHEKIFRGELVVEATSEMFVVQGRVELARDERETCVLAFNPDLLDDLVGKVVELGFEFDRFEFDSCRSPDLRLYVRFMRMNAIDDDLLFSNPLELQRKNHPKI